jgi:DNA-binding CsgD family transcriptional regulator/tetratricopeptide (TPR) repeat protein
VTVLLEREGELSELEAAIEAVRAGSGRAMVIEASAGLGKTRLLQEARRAGEEAGLTILSARATELERDFTFALARQLFVPRLMKLSDEEREQVLAGAAAARPALGLGYGDKQDQDSFAVLHDLYWVTATLAEREPLLLSIDDAHWADATSLDYLGFMLPRLEELPVLLVITVRSDEPEQPQGLDRILGDPALGRLSPQPLSGEGTTTLLTGELGRQPPPAFSAVCHEVSGGNPFLLSELARSLIERGIDPTADHVDRIRELAPERVARSVLLRLERLSPGAGDVARALAVLGEGSDPRLVSELAGLSPEAGTRCADELRAAAVLDEGASLRFIHPLVRNAVYTDVAAGERARVHCRAADLLRERGAGPEEIATQLLAGEPREDRAAAETLLEAGERALATGAPRSAVTYLQRALEEPPPADLRAVVLGPLITACFRAVDHAAWAAIEPQVIAELERDPGLRTRWAAPLTMAMAMGGRFEEAAAMLAKAVEVAAEEGDLECAYQLEAQLSTLAQIIPSAPQVDLSRYAEQIQPDSPAGRLAAAIEARAAVVELDREGAAAAAKRALGSDGIIFAEEPELVAAAMAALTLIATEELDFARLTADRALAIARERGATPDLARALYLRGIAFWAHGEFVAAEADMQQAMDLARMAGIPPLIMMFSGAFVEILVERDELERADAELGALGVATDPMPESPLFSFLLLGRGHLRLERGEFEAALDDYGALMTLAEQGGYGPGPSVMATPFAVEAMIAVGEQERAVELSSRNLSIARRWGAPATLAHILRAHGAVQVGAQQIAVLEEAVAVSRSSPHFLEQGHCLVALGKALRRQGRREEARVPLREALQSGRKCGAVRIAKHANAELQATGVKVRRYTPIGVESLTPSERRVAELAASGMTNRQIAQSLFVTVKTVEAHLSATYGKLDIGSRRELEGALGTSSPEDP